ncbi:S9 family peptidase [Sphingomonas sp. ABOLD]|uniref:Acyl-peptide hydrolase n=1 Tax=Sphingomonas trueperi TaxID=53317 RepID=A0A7X6BF42_9SPHN|nr:MULTISPECIES: alpha/beta fold hydrolase [Sphingomonas]NJB99990.1 dipeptidyl aminopeptidase/acylaminoacyl peptidase [Sphingomonas trueperi]RSV38768.1 S9 family peptidase [Sphingomonas sp. ABOLD]
MSRCHGPLRRFLRSALLIGPALLVMGAAAQSRPDHRPAIARLLALPMAVGLTGARDRPVFAWVELRAGVRNIWLLPAPGQSPRRLTDRTIDDGVDLHSLALNRDGTRIAWTQGGDAEFPDLPPPNSGHAARGGSQSVWVRATATGGAARSLGEGHAPVFSPDGERVAFVVGGTLLLASAADGPAAKLAQLPGKIEDLSWAPDGKRLLFVSRRGDHGLIALFDLADGTLSYPDPGMTQDVSPIFSPDGASIAFIRTVTPPFGATGTEASYWSIRIVDLATGLARTAWRAGAGAGGDYYGTRTANLLWSADDRLLFPSEASGWVHVLAVPARGGTAIDLTPGEAEVENFTLSVDRRTLIYAGNQGDLERRHVWQQPLAGGRARQWTPGDGIEGFPTVAGNALAVVVSDVRRPPHVALVAGAGVVTPLGAYSDPAETRDFVAPQPVRFTAEDGVTVHATLFRARRGGNGQHPALIFLHGGPRRQMLPAFHLMPYYASAYLLNQHLAMDGFDVLAINYRSGTGYGRAFREAAETGREGASEYRDVLAAARWLAARRDIDPHRIGLWGGSWGGYLTALGLARDSAMFAAGVDLHGVHDLVRAPPPMLPPAEQDRWRAMAWQSSPAAAIDRWRSPVLLVHGDDDRNVDFAQSVRLAAALTARGVPLETLMLPDERHEFFRYQSWVQAYAATDGFLDRTLGGSAP